MAIKPKTTPIYQTSVFTFEDLNELEAYFEQPSTAYMYTRFANPNSDELAAAVKALEQGAGAVVTSSGMSAILTAVLTYCESGDHLLCAEEIYGGSSVLLSRELRRLGIGVTYVPLEDMDDVSPYVTEKTKMLLTETMTNPFLNVQDIQQLASQCRRLGLKLVVDNTFATPVLTRPLTLGADMVIHSVTKYLSGHSDVTAGVVVAQTEPDGSRAQEIVVHYGLNLSPFESWLAARGLKTLHLRVKQHSANALAIARYLERHPRVKKVYYPGLPSHPQHQLAKRQGNGLFGGMLSFVIDDDPDTVNRFMRALTLIPFAPSLAGVQSSLSHPLKTSHRALTPEKRKKLGITMGLIRLSVGIEETEELIADLEQALDSIAD
ncbi:Cys/Met metabolism pyridoxal-phosphate-dependent protein [Caldalkalibacillus thermarum TA2.A1]|nr:aminotransferase class I/II-fold pyridoxal phosphate-dependent enzyme [Caldalkalibacillus thermarum]EGL83920.1 Cys/Met metabolism pyridoxal-phosphate-dependent protein [Caldalkalibacillus thermarum TA2.A1]